MTTITLGLLNPDEVLHEDQERGEGTLTLINTYTHNEGDAVFRAHSGVEVALELCRQQQKRHILKSLTTKTNSCKNWLECSCSNEYYISTR